MQCDILDWFLRRQLVLLVRIEWGWSPEQILRAGGLPLFNYLLTMSEGILWLNRNVRFIDRAWPYCHALNCCLLENASCWCVLTQEDENVPKRILASVYKYACLCACHKMSFVLWFNRTEWQSPARDLEISDWALRSLARGTRVVCVCLRTGALRIIINGIPNYKSCISGYILTYVRNCILVVWYWLKENNVPCRCSLLHREVCARVGMRAYAFACAWACAWMRMCRQW